MRSGVLAGGNWIVDHVKIVDAWPPQDSLATILSESSGNGGEGEGRAIRADCEANGINTFRLRAAAGSPTSYTDVMTSRDDGRRTFFHQRGANALLSGADFD